MKSQIRANYPWNLIAILVSFFIAEGLKGNAAQKEDSIVFHAVSKPDAQLGIKHYSANRPPLVPSPLVRLPLGTVRAHGWLQTQLKLEAEGFIGHLHELSRFLAEDENAWLNPEGIGDKSFWEELPYWLKGYIDVAYLLNDEAMIQEAKRWIEPTITGQRSDGWIGPRRNLEMINSPRGKKPDLWPNMIMLHVLQSYYEVTNDPRVIELMKRYYRWELTQPEEDFLLPYWQKVRASDDLVIIYWLYNRTGESWLLELGEKINRCQARWDEGIINWHGVNIAQGFRAPGIFYQQRGEEKLLSMAYANYDEIRDKYGQVPGGLYGADENCRPGYTDPRQAAETCAMVEMMYSCELLTAISGDPCWADRCEDVAFNSLPASMTPDLKSLRYLTAPNLAVSDAKNKSPGVQNRGPMFLFDPYGHRCCQHNVSHGWPYFTKHLWMAAPGDGLAAVLYAPSRVDAHVGNAGQLVTITEETKYPFDDEIVLTINCEGSVAFPLYLRVPRWCDQPEIEIRSEAQVHRIAVPSGVNGQWLVTQRTWQNGDVLQLKLPRTIRLRVWEKNHNSVSVDYGPVTLALKLGERYVRAGGTDKWPAWEIYPEHDWNYGLVLDPRNPDRSFEVKTRPWDGVSQPFTPEAAPIVVTTKGKKIPNWTLDENGLVAPLQQSPVKVEGPTVTLELIPMGCERLRISAFPVIGEGPDAVEWQKPAPPPHQASHCFESDTVLALSDRLEPKSSHDKSIPRFTWWPHRGTQEWVTYEFGQERLVSEVAVYWFDDTGSGACRVPKNCRVQYWDGTTWNDVTPQSQCDANRDQFNTLRFNPVKTTKLRLLVELQPDFSAGILEWRVK
ncbi:MAG: beta-L-arabinofuranosidase domain-containing protein [Thermogutta sp.]